MIRMGGDTQYAAVAAHNASAYFRGKANLAGDMLVEMTMTVHEAAVGALIGQNGAHLREMKATCGAHIEVSEWAGASATRYIHLSGETDMVLHAQHIVDETIREALAVEQPQSSSPAAVTSFPLPLPKPRPRETSTSTVDEPLLPSVATPEYASLLEFPPLPGAEPVAQIWGAPTGKEILNDNESSSSSHDASTVDCGSERLLDDTECGSERLLDDAVWLGPQVEENKSATPAVPASSPTFGCPAEPAVPAIQPALLLLQRQHSARTVSRLVGHASWCLLKDRIAVMAAFREALSNLSSSSSPRSIPATCTFEASEQEAKAAEQGIRFGMRSRSWANFVNDRPDDVQVQAQ